MIKKMKLQDQVCTFEQAKRLNELGIIQGKSIFFYNTKDNKVHHNTHTITGGFVYAEFAISVFTVAELGLMLPPTIEDGVHIPGYLNQIRDSKDFYLDYTTNIKNEPENNYTYKIVARKTEAEARAAMLIHLLEANLISIEDINNKLNSEQSVQVSDTTEVK